MARSLHPMLKQVRMGLASPLARFDDRLSSRPPVREDGVTHLRIRTDHPGRKVGEQFGDDIADGTHGFLPVGKL